MKQRRIGLTGGIGSGKTTVAAILIKSGFQVYNADDRAKELLDSDVELKDQVKSLLGPGAFTEDGSVNRKAIADQVFSDPAMLLQLNAIIHPATFADFEKWSEKHSDQEWIFKEAAILLETGADKNLDGVILVQAPLPLRIQRVIERDKTTEEQVLQRIARQWPEDKKVNHADFIIFNDGIHPLDPQVERAIAFFKNKPD